jgi:hypothetical protein
VLSHFCELKPKLSKGFQNSKWLSHFEFALVAQAVINSCKAYPLRIYGNWLQKREKLAQKYFE